MSKFQAFTMIELFILILVIAFKSLIHFELALSMV